LSFGSSNMTNKDYSQLNLTLSREAACVHWGFTILRVPDTLNAPVAVSKVAPLSSASNCGLRPGDILLSVNGRQCNGMTLREISDIILRDNFVNVVVARPGGASARNTSPYMTSTSPASYSDGLSRQVYDMFHPLPRSPMSARRYDPASVQDQEREIYEEEKRHEQIAIKTFPYRSQAVVSPKPKTKHDHVIGSYLQMQHYPDAPLHGSPLPHMGRTPSPGNLSNHQRFQSYVQQVDPHAAELGVKMPYNSPIGLYSRENALDTLQKTSGNQIPQPIRLVPDQSLVDGSDFARNLATSPTYRMVQEQEKGRDHGPVRERVHSPVVDYGSDQYYDAGRPESPRQSASFKHLMHSLVVHQGAMV